MGATNNIKDTNITLKLVGLPCANCWQKFTMQDIDSENYDLYFDTTNEVELKKFINGYYFSIRIRSIEHLDCPEKENDYEQ